MCNMSYTILNTEAHKFLIQWMTPSYRNQQSDHISNKILLICPYRCYFITIMNAQSILDLRRYVRNLYFKFSITAKLVEAYIFVRPSHAHSTVFVNSEDNTNVSRSPILIILYPIRTWWETIFWSYRTYHWQFIKWIIIELVRLLLKHREWNKSLPLLTRHPVAMVCPGLKTLGSLTTTRSPMFRYTFLCPLSHSTHIIPTKI